MTKRLIVRALLLCAFLVTGSRVVAQVSAQLRDQVTRQAASMALSATWVHEELRLTGFLDDPKTKEIVERSPAAYALAWAALQAEQKNPGTAVQLLQDVAQGIAANHSDAIRHEPALKSYFQMFPQNQPVPRPTARQFDFARSVEARPDIAKSLPEAAQEMITPLAKYSYAYPGGMQGMMVEVLRISPTDAMSIEQSSPDVERALFTAIERAPVPPPQETHLKDVFAALLTHGGEAIRYEDAVRRFGPDIAAGRRSRLDQPLAIRNAPKNSASVEERHERNAIATLAGQLVASLQQNPDRGDVPQNRYRPSLQSLPSSPPPRFSTKPSFEERARQLHSESVETPISVPEFTEMRSIGGGRGGGGIVMGGEVTVTFRGKPIGLSFRPIERSQLVVAVVAMSDGRVLFSRPVRPDILVAAYRIAFGDPDRNRRVARMSSKQSAGAILISLLARENTPVNVSEFLVHPAISDLQLGRDLIAVDGAYFLFAEDLEKRLGKVQRVDTPANSSDMSVVEWRAAIASGEFGYWYRYVERPLKISLQNDALVVSAANELDSNVLFELVRPAERKQRNDLRMPSPDFSISPLLPEPRLERSIVIKPERSVVIRDITSVLAEFRTLNDFLDISAIMRWAQDSGAKWFGGRPQTVFLEDVRSVVRTDNSATFDSRGAVDIELAKIHEIIEVLPAGIPAGKQVDAQRLNRAIKEDYEMRLLRLELSSRGYSSQVEEQAALRFQMSRPKEPSHTDQIYYELLKRDMPASEYEQLKRRCEMGEWVLYLQATRREPWIADVLAAWQARKVK